MYNLFFQVANFYLRDFFMSFLANISIFWIFVAYSAFLILIYIFVVVGFCYLY